MHISAATTLLAVLYMITNSAAQNLVAWSGNACDGDEGDSVPCDGSCHQFGGRHSYEASIVSSGTFCATLFEDTGCTGEAFFFNASPEGECINVNTGTDIESFSCSSC
ncbi:hypothetical protein BDP27DRAFT_1233022 [Rhodocollybia butyracea]|uniref:Uncharacterized protein n=1 Tax=Rhodocollybia butyracea TaxID=206335 RepID=A0A9P5U2P3_9AGAR|nr:hypothetical protein BDP27DRAFT_1233022 [Rhodocollybia butyracea]